jgi:hypothetical protein
MNNEGDPMVARMKPTMPFHRSRGGGRSQTRALSIRNLKWRRVAALVLCVAFYQTGEGQNIINSGPITNFGSIRVRGVVTGLPATVDGAVEYFGANQSVQATQYRDLMLTGSGTKTSVGGSFSVSGNVDVGSGVVLDVESGETITLIGNLIEQGYLRGGIAKIVNLTGGVTTSNFGDIGATLSWSGSAPGQTTVTRVSGDTSVGNGNQSILRHYDIAVSSGSGLNGTLTFRYTANELNGRDANALELWRSPDGGATWRRQTGTNFPGINSIVKSGIVGFSRWTATDTSNLLGPAAYEWVASSLATISGDGQSGPASAVLAPFVVTVADFYGNPISGTAVTFVVDSIPSGAAGYSLSVTNAVTNASGQVSTVLTLGNTSGIYRVRASSGLLSGSPRTFTATASSAAAAMASIAGNNQIDTVQATIAPFQVEVQDGVGNSVPGIIVNFAITGRPVGETGSGLSTASATSNGLGVAGTSLRFGNRIGLYEVTATSASLPGVQIRFNATATAGAAATMLAQLGTTVQQDTVLQSLDSLFAVLILDRNGNAVVASPVAFAILSVPAGATGQSLSATTANTDVNGIASSRLTLGSRTGTYQVTATSGSIINSPIVFNAVAVSGVVVPLTFRLFQNYPNPFNAQTKIDFEVPDFQGKLATALVQVFSLQGEKVKTLARGEHAAGRYTVTWDGTDAQGFKVPSGVYFYRLVSTDYITAKKMIMIK